MMTDLKWLAMARQLLLGMTVLTRLLELPSSPFLNPFFTYSLLTYCMPSWPYVAFLECHIGFLLTVWVPSWPYIAFLGTPFWASFNFLGAFLGLHSFFLDKKVMKGQEGTQEANESPRRNPRRLPKPKKAGQEGTQEANGSPRRQAKKST